MAAAAVAGVRRERAAWLTRRLSLQVNMLVIELKSEALKDRHWKQLMKRLHVNWVVSELTLGQIWDVDLQKNEAIVKDVLLVAQGEMALEEFLKQVRGAGRHLRVTVQAGGDLRPPRPFWSLCALVARAAGGRLHQMTWSLVLAQIREVWNTYELDLVNYQNKCRLIRGWDDLFNKVKEHINSVSAMKLSPYYKVPSSGKLPSCSARPPRCHCRCRAFCGQLRETCSPERELTLQAQWAWPSLCGSESPTFALFLPPARQVFEEDALSWEDKLNRIMALFDVWIDVQRRWVYLEGIFTGSADIKHLLPVETQRFQR